MSLSLKQPELFPREDIDLFQFENEAKQQGCFFVAGIDEAGRGPLAGPVVAAALVIVDHSNIPKGVNDSKSLTPKKRLLLFDQLTSSPSFRWATGIVDAEEIDNINILNATHLAMKLAVSQLLPQVDFSLVDGLPVKGLPTPHKAIVKGDSRSYSIAAASIIAKETRDQIMLEYAAKFPQYGFEKHKGYGTALHLNVLNKIGICPIHRKSFSPVREALNKHERSI